LLIPLPILLSSVAGFRSVAAVVGLTTWWEGTSFFILFGIGGWITAGFVYAALPHLLGRDLFSNGLAKRHLKLTLVGVIVTSAALWMSGMLSGFTWAGGTYGGNYLNTGEGFAQTLDAVSFVGVLALLGVLITFAGQLFHGYLVFRTVTSGSATAQEVLVPVEADGE
jgi:cytochrome c oxidase cbb3-type subunit 1